MSDVKFFIPHDFEANYAVYYAETMILEMKKPISQFRLKRNVAEKQMIIIAELLQKHGSVLEYTIINVDGAHVVLEFRKKN